MNSRQPAALNGSATQVTLSRRIAAIEIYQTGDGNIYSGMIAELPEGAQIEIAEPGFNERTVIARCKKQSYYVYLRDLDDQIA